MGSTWTFYLVTLLVFVFCVSDTHAGFVERTSITYTGSTTFHGVCSVPTGITHSSLIFIELCTCIVYELFQERYLVTYSNAVNCIYVVCVLVNSDKGYVCYYTLHQVMHSK